VIGRKAEIKVLESLCNEPESKLVVIHGRRRVGKTYLVDYMFNEYQKECMFFDYTGDYDGDNHIQLKNFTNSIYSWFKATPRVRIDDWSDAFNFLKLTIENEIEKTNHKEKIILFFDEIPWIDKNDNHGFLSALGHFWNTYCVKNKKFIMILCASNASWVTNKVIKDKAGPLHKRVDKVINLKPFTLKETKEYLIKEKGYEADDMSFVDIYMIFGGVAKYLSYLDASKSISQNVDEIVFSLDGMLFDEYETVFYTLFRDKHQLHKAIMDALSTKQSGLDKTQLASALQLSPSDPRIGAVLNDLMQCGFVFDISKYGSIKKGNRYTICDPYSLFYKKWIEPVSKNEIAKVSGYWTQKIGTPSYTAWSGFAFEIVCMANIEHYLEVRGTRGVFKGVYCWNYIAKSDDETGAQIDLVVEYTNNLYDLVECKYSNDEFVIDKEYSAKLLNKKNMFAKYGVGKKRHDIKMVMLTTFGTKKNQYYHSANISNDITLAELI
jgi:uncharacterized protein